MMIAAYFKDRFLRFFGEAQPQKVRHLGNGEPLYDEYQVIVRDKAGGVARSRHDFSVPLSMNISEVKAYHETHFTGTGYVDWSTLKYIGTNSDKGGGCLYIHSDEMGRNFTASEG